MAINYLQYYYQVYLIIFDKNILRFMIECNTVFNQASSDLKGLFNRVKMPHVFPIKTNDSHFISKPITDNFITHAN
jgi:hypothetical protein